MRLGVKAEKLAGFKCPVCGDILEYFSNIHCKNKHNMSRSEVTKKYGQAQPVYFNLKLLKEDKKYNNYC